jgi:outer membrane protein assembly factor BamB
MAVALLSSLAVAAGPDWPQWGGPKRDFKYKVKGLAEKWPEGGPKKLWSRELGDGYSAVVSDGAALYTMYSVRGKDEKGQPSRMGDEFIVALDPATGSTLWEHKYAAPWGKDLDMEFGPGPHSTPLLAGDRLLAVGTTAKFHCLDRKTGKVHWSHDLVAEHQASLLGRGYGSSPIVYRDTVILPIGGKGQSIIAWKLGDGKLAWKNQDFDGTFASLILIKVDGEEQLVAFTAKEVAGLDPADGSLKWTFSHPTQFGANISTPVPVKGNRLFISSAYGMGSRGLQLSRKDGKTEAKELWFNPKMKIHFGNAVAVGDTVYGACGDFGPAFFCAVDMTTGEIAWKQRGIAKANCLYADKKLIILDEDGRLILARADPEGYEEIGRAQVCKKNAWTVPTLVGKTLYVRDRKTIMALDLG